jgi:glutamyl-tRNA synthetase
VVAPQQLILGVVPPGSEIRCRFAPSPTGYLHVGSAQSALFNWLFARSTAAQFLLRIEDTDAERNRPELTDNILDMLRWLGIEWDGKPVHQSDRAERHRLAAERLASGGRAYWCDCTREDLERRAAERGRAVQGYDGHCRERDLPPGAGRALRFRRPLDAQVTWPDVVRGPMQIQTNALDDFVIVRSNGTPLFIVANTVDDAEMGITHVIRGEDHLSNTPKYILLWEALEFGPLPTFAHLPLLVNEQRKKLSKRRDDVSVADYKARGFLGAAMRNYLALLGWAPPDEVEVRPIEEIVALFRLDDVNPSPAFFDVQKLTYVNGEHIRSLPVEEFVRLASEFLPPGDEPLAALRALAPLVQERVKTLAEVPEMLEFLWVEDMSLDEAAWAKATKDERADAMLDSVARALGDVAWDADSIEQAVRGAGVAAGFVNDAGEVQLSKAQAPLRVAITGKRVGPPLWESLVALGRERTLDRIARARDRLGARS